MPSPASVSPSCTKLELCGTTQLWGFGFGVAQGMAALDVLPFTGKAKSSLAGGFLAYVWHWVSWLEPTWIEGNIQKMNRKAEKLM